MAVRTFRDSGPRAVFLKKDESCSLKRHYKNVLREIIGWLDKKASEDPERFVELTIPELTKVCKKFLKDTDPKDREGYSQNSVEKAIAYFREIRAISKPVERVRRGALRRGFIVAPHDGQFRRNEKGQCLFEKFLGRWESSGPDGTIWWEKS